MKALKKGHSQKDWTTKVPCTLPGWIDPSPRHLKGKLNVRLRRIDC